MSDYPPDVPRLRTIERYLLVQLAAVRRAIDEAENGTPRARPPAASWHIVWRWGPAGQPRVGTLHTADCFLARGDPLTTQQVQAARREPGKRVDMCETCQPQLP